MFDKEMLAKDFYSAYGDNACWVNYQKLSMPTWEDLPENIKSNWIAVVNYVLDKLL
jgi:hypothetical protein